ncbi:diguanylate cyclase [Paucibacter sp. R3-3]|uniref:diguanylate cyclase n=1 Tax=Roseateles agri TaxID=3098619 RepID=A0ABU5DCX5_9BURK|nr:diguanylate cyclase [Paucibacter sp. R3-3]MDY0744141.1 diguanylate cyclase [Paucibacter sp. R3-3]
MLVVSLGSILVANARSYEAADDWVEHTHAVLAELDQVRVTMLRGGIALRDYALVPKPDLLDRTRTAADEAVQAAQRLETLVQDNRAQAARAAEVSVEVRAVAAWYVSSAATGEREGGPALQRLLGERITVDGARRLRQFMDEMQLEERALLKARQTNADRELASLKGWSTGLGAVFLSFIFGTVVYSRRLVRAGDEDMTDLAKSANSDALTGLANRRALQKRVQKLRAQPFGVLVFDLDDFKPINDRYGHAAGDQVLKAVAKRLRQLCRNGDLAVRTGGDEFVVLFPGLDDTGRLEEIRTRLRQAIGEPILLDSTPVKVGASIGYASTNGDKTFDQLIELADAMSYEEKKVRKAASGR